MTKSSILIPLSLITILSITGCSTIFEKELTPYEPQNMKEIEGFTDKRIEQFNKRYYQQNFIKKEIANSEMEIGIQTINKNVNQNYLKETIEKDELDIVPEINVKVISKENIIINKIVDSNTKKNIETTIEKSHDIEKIKILSKNDIVVDNNYSIKYKNSFPLLIGENNELLKRDLKTNVEYVLTINDIGGFEIFEKQKDCSLIETKNTNLSCFLDIKNYKESPVLSSKIYVYFIYNNEKIKFYNQKFNSEKNIGEILKIKLNSDKSIFIKVGEK
jgi:hypothetical protein